jgi:DNA-binding PadR family transcriptional regulator
MTPRLNSLGRYAGPGTLILSSLAGGAKHGYALKQDIEAFANVTLGPGTLYGALTRLEEAGLVAALDGDGRRRPYELTANGGEALSRQLTAQREVAEVGLRRLSVAGGAVPA